MAQRRIAVTFVQTQEMAVIAFDERHWSSAVQAFLRYGRKRHPAALNFGDCLTYATARLSAEPLLCVGEDFAKTDLDVLR